MKHFKNLSSAFFLLAFVLLSHNPAIAQSETNGDYEIAASEYSELAEKAIKHLEKFQWNEFYKMISDDAEFHLPDGDAGTRTSVIGKKANMDFWNTYEEKSGNTKMVMTNPVYIPVLVKEKLNYTGLTGPSVIVYISMEMHYGVEVTNVRMNWGIHFNEQKQIDRIYTYYDRTPIIEAAKRNLLAKK